MHFNRTQFATKTLIRLFALAILIVVFLLSSCTDAELDRIISTQYKWPRTIYWMTIKNSPSFSIDSIRYDSTSIYKVCSSIRFDSTIALAGFTFNYWETGTEMEVSTIHEIDDDPGFCRARTLCS